jgi:2EXR family
MSSKPGVKEYISLKPKVKKGIFRKLKAEQGTPPESEGKTSVLFTKFPNLPDELQVLIWEFAIVGAGPRLVEIITRPLARKQPCQMETEAAENVTPKPKWGITSDCPVPLLLLACYMSYEIASKHY